MLVLSRRDQETVVIDGNIKITVIRTTGNSVRLGIEAPPHVSVNRGEVQARIDAEANEGTQLLQRQLAERTQRPPAVGQVPSLRSRTNDSDAA